MGNRPGAPSTARALLMRGRREGARRSAGGWGRRGYRIAVPTLTPTSKTAIPNSA